MDLRQDLNQLTSCVAYSKYTSFTSPQTIAHHLCESLTYSANIVGAFHDQEPCLLGNAEPPT